MTSSPAPQPERDVEGQPWWRAFLCGALVFLVVLVLFWPVVTFYLYKLVVPVNLVIDYGRTPAVIIERGWIWWTWAALLVPVATLVPVRRRAPLVIAGALVFVPRCCRCSG